MLARETKLLFALAFLQVLGLLYSWDNNQTTQAQLSRLDKAFQQIAADLKVSGFEDLQPTTLSDRIDLDSPSAEQVRANQIIMVRLSELQAGITNLENTLTGFSTSDKDPQPPVEYQPAEFYANEQITAAIQQSESIIQNAISAQAWTAADNAQLIELVPFLDSGQKDYLREEIMTAINAQQMALESPLNLPF